MSAMHRGGRHGDYGGQPASSFQNAVTVLHLETKLKLYNYTNSLPVAARCWFEQTRLSTASASRWLPPREPLSLKRCRARAPCRGARCRRLLWGPERVWLLSRLSLRRRVLSGSVCSRCFAADVQPVIDLQTLLLAVAGEAPTAGGVIRLVAASAAPVPLQA